MSDDRPQRTTPGPGLPPKAGRPVRLELSMPESSHALALEPRRALAVLRAVNLLGDPGAVRALLRFIGKDLISKEHVSLSEADCEQLAKKLRQRGYPLTDEGLRTFKLQRGLSGELRVGPEVAAAFARYAAGRDVRVNVAESDWQTLGLEAQRAMKLLALVAEDPHELSAVARALGRPNPISAKDETPTLDRALADSLVKWAHDNRIELTNDGMVRLAESLQWPAAIIDGRLARFITEALLNRGEPVHDYSRLTFQACTLNGRTVAMLSAAEHHTGGVSLKIIKGSYVADGEKGAHPHLGGGVADLSSRGLSNSQIERFVRGLRRVGFAAWFRDRDDTPHVHAVAIGDREMSPAALWQVRQYFQGKDGRSHMGPDPHGGFPVELPTWVLRYRLAL